jgi:ADP-heptose:LPS heptosyltransferase
MSEKYIVFHIDGGVGKSVLATAVCSSIKKAHPERKIIVITAWPEVFLHNPEIYRVYKAGNFAYFYEDFIKDKDSLIFRLEPYHSSDFIHQSKSLIEIWCDLFQIPCISLQPKLFLTQREIINAQSTLNTKDPILMIHPFGGGDNAENSYSWARDLPPVLAQNLVNKLHKNFGKVLQIRRDKQIVLDNTVGVSDSLRNIFCYVHLSTRVIAIDSMIQHIAAALNKPAAVGWIANSPKVFGHELHTNIPPSQRPAFRHSIDSYLEELDWTGKRHYECPYDDINNIFKEEEFLKYCEL